MAAVGSSVDAQAAPIAAAGAAKHPIAQSSELEFVKCECCGLTEECTQAYIARVRERFDGRWVCGLCAEAVKDEERSTFGIKSNDGDDLGHDVNTAEALKRHLKFCQQFKSSSPPTNPTEDLIYAMKQLLRRTLDSPRMSPARKKKGSSVFPSSSPSDLESS